MNHDQFAYIISQHRKVALTGGPKTGKTTLSQQCVDRHVYRTDDWQVIEWAHVPDAIIDQLESIDSWILEGVQVPRCLRKGLKPNVVIWLDKPHVALSSGQRSMAKGCRTIYEEWIDMVQRTEQFESVDMDQGFEVVTLRWNDE
jgi:hypothetical protein